ncbi:hypothetical protein A5663_01985 [Mycobacterium sp. E740]|nr:hypothetical protein A5663_01985 [Mycobacterium sp. E740]
MEQLYDEALEALYAAVRQQITVKGVGYFTASGRQRRLRAPEPLPGYWTVRGHPIRDTTVSYLMRVRCFVWQLPNAA